jgi:ribose/xylose/arabinose/galactoside ABC-type transport system permease subunit
VFEGFPLLGLVALGVAVTMIAGELDLSVGSMAALAGVVAVKSSSAGLVPAVLAAVAAGMAIGALQGTFIARLGINSLVFTIGTLILLRGATYMASGGPNGQAPVTLDDLSVSDALLGRYWIFSVSSLTALGVFCVVGLFLAFVRYGREIYAIGGARTEALAAGVRSNRALTVSFTISAGCASLAGALASLRGGSAAPENYADVLLAAVAGAALGGISLYGGRGSVLNVVLGVGVLSVVTAGLAIRGVQSSTVQLVTGALLLGSIALEFVASRVTRGVPTRTGLPPFLRRPRAAASGG